MDDSQGSSPLVTAEAVAHAITSLASPSPRRPRAPSSGVDGGMTGLRL